MSDSYVIGIDVGGTNTAYGIVDAQGNIVAKNSLSTQVHGDDVEAYVSDLSQRIRDLIDQEHLGLCIAGVGIGAPNGNHYTRSIENAANLPWKQKVPLADMLQKELHLPVTLDNDANAATIGEMLYGSAKGMKNFIMITLGTGLGSGIVVDGKLVYGQNGCAGELGHVIVTPDGRACGCGRRGCLEAYASAVGVARTALILLSERYFTPSILRDIPAGELTSKQVFLAAQQGDEIAREVFEQTGETLGKALANFATFSAPEAIVLFGGLVRSGEFLLAPVRRALEEHSLKMFLPKLLTSILPEGDAALLGAAALAWQGCLEEDQKLESFLQVSAV